MGIDATGSNHRFDRFLLQPMERRLLADGTEVSLGPRAFDVLVLLVQNAGRLVTKDRLLSVVWPRVVVEENALQAQVSMLRKVLGRDAIATVSGRGYRFTASVVPEAASIVAGDQPATSLRALPAPLTSFVGRQKELVELSQLLRNARLLTLTGSGGCGKTRLALQVASGVGSMFADGVLLVELAALSDPELVPQALAGALELPITSPRPLVDVIAAHLASRQMLIVLDNAEHLLEASARLADELLKRCARVALLVTSRESLGITGELTFRVPSLSVPDVAVEATPGQVLQYESVRLFVARAQLQRPHFAVTEQNAPALASLCRRLDGIPLAIELAAARLRAMAPEEIDRRLDRRFSLLIDGSRTAMPRHRTLQSLIDWSYDLLDAPEQALFCRVAVFADGWTLEAGESVCAAEDAERLAMLDRLTSLVDKSLVTADEQDGVTRYRLLETMRQYGLARLRENAEEAVWRTRHLDCMVALAKLAEAQLTSGEQRAGLDRLGTEHENLRAALTWAADGGSVTSGLRLAAMIFHFWWTRGFVSEGREFLKQLLASTREPVYPAVRARALAAAGQFAMLHGDYAAAWAVQQEALAIYRELDNRNGMAALMGGMGVVLDEQGEFDRAWSLREEAIAIQREVGLPQDLATALNNLGWSARNQGKLVEAQTVLEESLAIRRALGDTSRIADALLNLAGVALDRHELEAARRLGEESLAICSELRDRRGTASALLHMGLLACATQDWSMAHDRLGEALTGFVDLNDQSGVARTLDALALACLVREPARAARLLGAVEHIRQGTGFKLTEVLQSAHDAKVRNARAALGDDEAFHRAWSEGATMGLQAAARYALH